MDDVHACEIIELGDVELLHDEQQIIQEDIKGKLKDTVRELMASPTDKQMASTTERTMAPGADHLDVSIEEYVKDFT